MSTDTTTITPAPVFTSAENYRRQDLTFYSLADGRDKRGRFVHFATFGELVLFVMAREVDESATVIPRRRHRSSKGGGQTRPFRR